MTTVQKVLAVLTVLGTLAFANGLASASAFDPSPPWAVYLAANGFVVGFPSFAILLVSLWEEGGP